MSGPLGDVVHDSEDESYLSLPAARANIHLAPPGERAEVALPSVPSVDSSRLPPIMAPSAIIAQPGISTPATPYNMMPSDTNPHSNSSVVTPTSKPAGRPRPRPIKKDSPAYFARISNLDNSQQDPLLLAPRNSATSAPTSAHSSSSLPGPSSIHDTEPAGVPPEPSYSHDIAERTKLRARARSSKAQTSTSATDDMIHLSSDEGEYMPKKSASKKKTKMSREPSSSKASPAKKDQPSSSKTASRISLLAPAEVIDLITQLPPSDPPIWSSSGAPTTSPSERPDAATAYEVPASPPVGAIRKRKRPQPYNALEDDSEGFDDLVPKPAQKMAAPVAPPPPFFVGSSQPSEAQIDLPLPGSSSNVPVAQGRPSNVEQVPKPDKKRGKRVEDDDEDWTADVQPKSKAKTRKKAIVSDDEEWGQDLNSSSKRRKKGKTDGKSKGAASKKKTSPQKTVEVVIDRRSPTKDVLSIQDSLADAGMAFDRDLTPPPPSPPLARSPSSDSSPTKAKQVDTTTSSIKDSPTTVSESRSAKSRKRSGQSSNPPPSNDVFHLSEGEDEGPVRPSARGKGKKRAVALSDDEDDAEPKASPPAESPRTKRRRGNADIGKENEAPSDAAFITPARPAATPASTSKFSEPSRTYSIARMKSTPMSELLRKVNSLPGSPFASPKPAYSPYLKASKSFLKRIAPLHPNRRTPPPPPPRPPPPKKSKKQLELEEKWEMELEESVDGWYCLPEEERATLRRAKRDMEMGFED